MLAPKVNQSHEYKAQLAWGSLNFKPRLRESPHFQFEIQRVNNIFEERVRKRIWIHL